MMKDIIAYEPLLRMGGIIEKASYEKLAGLIDRKVLKYVEKHMSRKEPGFALVACHVHFQTRNSDCLIENNDNQEFYDWYVDKCAEVFVDHYRQNKIYGLISLSYIDENGNEVSSLESMAQRLFEGTTQFGKLDCSQIAKDHFECKVEYIEIIKNYFERTIWLWKEEQF